MESNPYLAILGEALGFLELFIPAGPSDLEIILDELSKIEA